MAPARFQACPAKAARPGLAGGVGHVALAAIAAAAGVSACLSVPSAYGQRPFGTLQEVGDTIQVTAGVIPAGGGDAQDADWRVEYYSMPDVEGLTAGIYLLPNPGNLAAIDAIIGGSAPDGVAVIANPHWSQDAGGFGYPEEFIDATGAFTTGNQENFIVNHTGELYIPPRDERADPGANAIRFKDGVDDFAFLSIAGRTLVNDNAWTGTDGSANGGSPIVAFDVSDPGYDSGKWVAIRFTAAEGGGGDNAALWWDALDRDGTFPEARDEPADAGDLIPDSHFRTSAPALVATVTGRGTPVDQPLETSLADSVAEVRLTVEGVVTHTLQVNTRQPAGRITQLGDAARVTAGLAPSDGGAWLPADWRVDYYGEGTAPGIRANIYLQANPGSLDAIESIIADAGPDGSVVIPNPFWSQDSRGLGYPEAFADATGQFRSGNQEAFIVDHRGEILIPAREDRADPDAAAINFKDGVDDFAYLEIDGEVLVDDNSWTGADGSENGGSPISPLDVSNGKFDDGEWVPIRFVTAEGGGGDGSVLWWDARDTDGTFPEFQDDPADDSDLIPDDHFRTLDLAVIGTATGTGAPDNQLLESPLTEAVLEIRLYVAGVLVARAERDRDGDGIPDTYEIANGLDPASDDGALDKDGDGLGNLQEFHAGTDPRAADSDGDGLADGVETRTGIWVGSGNTGTDPLQPDSDGDGLRDGAETFTGVFAGPADTGTDPLNPDSDGDGFADGVEVSGGSDPNDAGSTAPFPAAMAYWSFDDGRTVTADLAGGGIDGTLHGGADFVDGHSGTEGDRAVAFDGIDASVTTDEPLLDGLTAFTVAGWVRFEDAQPGRTGFFGQNDLCEAGPNTAISWWMPDGGTLATTVTTAPEWLHVALVGSSDGRILYLNGEEAATSTAAPGGGSSAFTFNIGGDGIWDAEGNFFTGEIDDVAVWDVALQGGHIAELAAQIRTPLGTKPSRRDAGFRITHITVDSTTRSVSLTFPTVPGGSYAGEFSDDMLNWIEFEDLGAETSESTLRQSDIPTNVRHRSYRVLRID